MNALAQFFRPVVYVTLQPERLTMRDVGSGHIVSRPPLAGVSNPFKHPRTLLADFTLGEQVVKGFMKELFAGRLFAPSPVVVLHPLVDPDGGFTQIEIRALHELMIGAGASRVIVWHGRHLTDEELRDLRFPADGEILQS